MPGMYLFRCYEIMDRYFNDPVRLYHYLEFFSGENWCLVGLWYPRLFGFYGVDKGNQDQVKGLTHWKLELWLL